MKPRRDTKREIASLCRILTTTQCTPDNVADIKAKIRALEDGMREGEPERDEEEVQRRRLVMQSNQGLSDVLDSMWLTVALTTDSDNCLTQRGYVRFFMVLAKVRVGDEGLGLGVEVLLRHGFNVPPNVPRPSAWARVMVMVMVMVIVRVRVGANRRCGLGLWPSDDCV